MLRVEMYDSSIKQLSHMLEETQRQLNNALSEVSQLRKSMASGIGGIPAESTWLLVIRAYKQEHRLALRFAQRTARI